MTVAPVTVTAENTNANAVHAVVVQLPPVTHSQPVEILDGQLPHIEVEDGAGQRLEEKDCPTSACHQIDDHDRRCAFTCACGNEPWTKSMATRA